MRRAGLQTEVLVSLALLMLAATGVAAAVVHRASEAQLRDAVGRALQREARAPGPPTQTLYPGTYWWRVPEGEGAAQPWGVGSDRIDSGSIALAAEARERGASVLRWGGVSGSMGFATPLPDGSVAVARLSAEASRSLVGVPAGLLLALLALDVGIFAAFGFFLLRRRVLAPLHRVEWASRALAEGDLAVRVPVGGVRETAELADRFNEMGDALSSRTEALEKAVVDLRAAHRDVQEAREGLDRAERLASVGHLAAGVAHEVGNPIGALLAFVDLARRDPGISDATREHLRRAAEQGGRVRTILRQLLDFSRPSHGEIGPVDVVEAAQEAATLVQAQRQYADVDLAVHAEGGVPAALADRGALVQIVLNLVLNAAHAVRSAGGGRVRVHVRAVARNRRADDSPGSEPPRRAPDGVELSVCDDGPGVPEEERERIFAPFYTTKEPGEGTGLGLSNAQRQVEAMGGSLAVVSPGWLGGASFQVVLPAVPAGAPHAVRSGA